MAVLLLVLLIRIIPIRIVTIVHTDDCCRCGPCRYTAVAQFVPAAVAYPDRIVPAPARDGGFVFGAKVAETFAAATTVMLLQAEPLKVTGTSFAVLSEKKEDGS